MRTRAMRRYIGELAKIIPHGQTISGTIRARDQCRGTTNLYLVHLWLLFEGGPTEYLGSRVKEGGGEVLLSCQYLNKAFENHHFHSIQ
jgi:hypothetical protein